MNSLVSVQEAAELIRQQKRPIVVAGSEALLRQLPKGLWIGGTIPYFMGPEGGVLTHEKVSVDVLPEGVVSAEVRSYSPSELSRIPADGEQLKSGCSIIITPAFSEVTALIGRDSQLWPGVFDRPLMGWVAGCEMKDIGQVAPLVFDGRTGAARSDQAVVLHCGLAPGVTAHADIVNIFDFGDGDELQFPEGGYSVKHVTVSGKTRVFGEYLKEKGQDTNLPLIADYSGARMNVSVQKVADDGSVSFYVPVFPEITYRFARPVGDFAEAFNAAIVRENVQADYACNCLFNFLLGGLAGRRAGSVQGPFTFGEIAYLLLNQTMVYLKFVKETGKL